MKLIIITFSLFITANCTGQDMGAIEQGLLKKFENIRYWSSFHTDKDRIDKTDSLEKANIAFQNALSRITANIPASLRYEFKMLQDSGLTIATSSDYRFRIYSWDTEEGGTMHIFASVYQYKTDRRVYSKTFLDSSADGDPGTWSTPIYTFPTSSKIYYLVINHAIFSHRDIYQEIKAYSIGKRSLNDYVRLFKTKTGLTNGISFEFNFFSVEDHPERPVQLIAFDSKKKEIRIPVVLEDGTVTNRSIIYLWTGAYFERK